MLSRLKGVVFLVFIGFSFVAVPQALGEGRPSEDDARTIVERAFDYWRGVGSVARFEMTIHRSDFERTMVLKGWTKGRQDALFFVEKPPKDAGNATLKKGREMWSFNPKINRVIKLPPSMMSQSWMGSDFSNDDLAKSDTMIDDYTHSVKAKTKTDEGMVYTIEAIAREDAPVVWSKQELDIREDNILLRQTFFDEEMVVVKEMTAEQIEMLGGRLFPRIWTMRRIDEEQRYTRMEYLELRFGADLDDRLFTLNSLKNRRR